MGKKHSEKQKLTDKQSAFVREYLIDFNATQAAIRAGYSENTAQQIGSENLSKLVVQEALTAKIGKAELKSEVTRERVIAELAKLGFSSLPDFVKLIDNSIKISDFDKLTDEQKACISEAAETKDGTLKIKLHDKKGALDSLARILGMFDDRLKTEDVAARENAIVRLAQETGKSVDEAREMFERAREKYDK